MDLVKIPRMRDVIARWDERFLRRVFTDGEIAYCRARRDPVPHFAARFAAKEAATKALGTGFRYGVHFRDIGVVNAPTGRPTLALSGGAARHLARLTPEGHILRIDLTLTDEYPMAEAVVIISAYRDKEDRRG